MTRRRMYLETMEEMLGDMDKIILDERGDGAGVVPYLPLDSLTRRPSAPIDLPSSGTSPAGASQ